MSQLPQHVSAISPIGAALNGARAGVPYSVPCVKGNSPPPPRSPSWACRVDGCPRQIGRDQAEQIIEHLRMHLTPYTSIRVRITPEMCKWWLDHSTLRRRIKETKWRKIFTSITEDGWIWDGMPFALDDDGNLVQGGHRARAILAAGIDVDSTLIGGIAGDAGLVMDTNSAQTFTDALIARGVPNASDVAGVTGLLWRLEHGQLEPKLAWDKRLTGTNPQLLRLYEARSGEIRGGIIAARPVQRTVKWASRAGLAVSWIAIRQVAGGEVDTFFAALALKGGYAPVHGERDPVAAWHRKWMGQSQHDKLRAEHQVALTIKCWNAFVTEDAVQYLTWRAVGPKAELFPVPVRPPLASREDEDIAVEVHRTSVESAQLRPDGVGIQQQKRELIAAELARDPDRSDREIGRLVGADHKTVGGVRRGEISVDPDEVEVHETQTASVGGYLGAVERCLTTHPSGARAADIGVQLGIAEHDARTYLHRLVVGRRAERLARGLYAPIRADSEPEADFLSDLDAENDMP